MFDNQSMCAAQVYTKGKRSLAQQRESAMLVYAHTPCGLCLALLLGRSIPPYAVSLSHAERGSAVNVIVRNS